MYTNLNVINIMFLLVLNSSCLENTLRLHPPYIQAGHDRQDLAFAPELEKRLMCSRKAVLARVKETTAVGGADDPVTTCARALPRSHRCSQRGREEEVCVPCIGAQPGSLLLRRSLLCSSEKEGRRGLGGKKVRRFRSNT